MLLINSTMTYLKLPNFISILPFLNGRNVGHICKVMTVLSKSSAVDSIDAFTYELLLNKRRKWESYRENVKHFNVERLHEPPSSISTVKHLSMKQIDNVIQQRISNRRFEDVIHIIAECAALNKTPSCDVLIELYYVYSAKGDIKTVKSLQELCCNLNFELYNANGNFDHYMAKALCFRGNLEKGMTIFLSVYETNHHLRWSVDNMLKEIIRETVANRSEASIVILRKSLEIFINKCDHYFPMTCFWTSCWLSEWFADQKLSEELFDKYEPLRKMITDRMFGASVALLRQGNEDAILRLLQTLLRHKMEDSYLKVLQLLFDYRLKQHNFRGCDEIIHNCKALSLSLGPEYHEKYLYMIIDGKAGTAPPTSTLTHVKPFKLKF